jgi:hypothetical protein
MKAFLFCAAVAVAAAPAALADEFCDDLKAVLAAGDERPAPYDSLVDPDPAKKFYKEKLASFAPGKLIRGLPEGAVCSRYLAGVADGVIGGGTHNYYRCDLGRADQTTRAQLDAKRDTVTKQISACLGPAGWTGGKNESVPGGGRLQAWRAAFKPANGPADILIDTEGRVFPNSTSYSMELKIRTPTLYVAPPKPAQ